MSKDELLNLAKLAIPFKAQQKGKRPDFLQSYIVDIVSGMPSKPTFKELLDEMELTAARRELKGERASPIEKIDRV